MQLDVVPQNFEVGDQYKNRITSRFTRALDKYLSHLQEDLKQATLTIAKNARFGYQAKFDMKLPFGHIFAQHRGQKLFTTLMRLRDQVKKQIRRQVDKLRN